LFHTIKTNKVMQVYTLSFLLFLQAFSTGQLEQVKALPSTAQVAVTSIAAKQENDPISARNIILQSVDGGQTWQDVSAGLPEGVQVWSILGTEGEVILGTETGIYRSSIMPVVVPVWEKEPFLDERINIIGSGRTGSYACSYGNGIYQQIPGTGVWRPIDNNLQDKSVHSILETSKGAIFIGSDSGIFKSTDGGTNWKQVFDDRRVTHLIETDGALVCSGHKGVLRSTDDGEHWDWVLIENGSFTRTAVIEGGIAAISSDGWKKWLQTSSDGGKTWQAQDDSAPSVRYLGDIKRAGEYLFYSTEEGIFRSSNQGITWELMLPTKDSNGYNLTVSGQVIFAVRLSGC
jgi:hypothetical protein